MKKNRYFKWAPLLSSRGALTATTLLSAVSLHSGLHGQEIPPAARVSQEVSSMQQTTSSDASGAARPLGRRAPTSKTNGQRDLGEQQVIVIKEDLNPISVGLSTGFLYTSNAGLTSANEQEDWIWTSGFQAAWTPRIFDRLYLNMSLRQDFYRYDEFDEVLDFDSLRVTAGLSYLVPKVDGLLVSVLYGLQRTTEPLSWSDSLFLSNSISIGVQKAFRFSRGNQLVASYYSEFSIDADPSELQRFEHVFQLAHQVRWTPKFDTTIAYRGAYNDYRELEEVSAWNHTAALVANYAFTNWLTTSANVSYIWNQAEDSAFDYEMAGFGASVNITIKF